MMTVQIRLAFIALLLLVCESRTQAQDSLTVHAVNKKRLRNITLVSSIGYGGTMVGLSELWYKNSSQQSFHFFNDLPEWKQVDKAGHFYSAFYSSYATSNLLKWCNMQEKKSALIGAVTGFLIMAPIEILDGYSEAYGASVGDLLFNAGGASFFLTQSLTWNEVRIYPKFSSHQTSYAKLRPNVLGDTWSSRTLKDYNGQTYWFSVDADKFFRFPKWLNIAVGYGAHDMVYARDNQNYENHHDAYRQYYLSLDFDLTSIKTKSKVIKTLIFVANMIKLPAPAIEFSRKGVRYHAFYF